MGEILFEKQGEKKEGGGVKVYVEHLDEKVICLRAVENPLCVLGPWQSWFETPEEYSKLIYRVYLNLLKYIDPNPGCSIKWPDRDGRGLYEFQATIGRQGGFSSYKSHNQ